MGLLDCFKGKPLLPPEENKKLDALSEEACPGGRGYVWERVEAYCTLAKRLAESYNLLTHKWLYQRRRAALRIHKREGTKPEHAHGGA